MSRFVWIVVQEELARPGALGLQVQGSLRIGDRGLCLMQSLRVAQLVLRISELSSWIPREVCARVAQRGERALHLSVHPASIPREGLDLSLWQHRAELCRAHLQERWLTV